MDNLVHLIYTSRATEKFSNTMLINLLNQSRANNYKAQITGILLYTEDSFFQIIEGWETAVKLLIEKLNKDSRHINITQIIYENILKRTFSEWSMGFVKLEKDKFNEIVGFNDFFSNHICLTDINSGRAKKVLWAFSQGYWRQNIT
ncbi:BLUF domain-containing protein [Legionella sp. D16C41]|uniref:BLUF domain-containing protein n=1 Tax=Legionella sp. D16C41 TaxID=3402688 RepID=UPI003AF9B676